VSGFDPEAFIASIRRMERVHPATASPLVVRGADLHWFEPEQLHNPSRIAMIADLPTLTFELFVQEIEAGGSSDMQRHHHETVHYVIAGSGFSEIGDERVEWEAGDSVYTPPWAWHRHYNASEVDVVRMLGIESSRLLERLGGLNRRQSLGLMTMAEVGQLGRDSE
jgi:mannose-6-phosphate isomerase-like protein (cupin superfamily)